MSAYDDGTYWMEVTLQGGSGRAGVASPAEVHVQNGEMKAVLVWSSSNYDRMTVDGTDYEPTALEPGSTFEIPVKADCEMEVTAETLAMSTPHEIAYTLFFDSTTMTAESPEAEQKQDEEPSQQPSWQHEPLPEIAGHAYEGSMELQYAHEFAIDRYEGGYQLIATAAGAGFLVIPEGAEKPETDIPVLQQPLTDIYLAATSAICLFDALDALDAIALSGTRAEDWAIEGARLAMEDGRIRYAGKYSEPDYELILASGCRLAVESAMIYHKPEVKEKLEELGIPVLIDYSSYETHPLGRTEWMKVYGVLTGKEAEADELFRKQAEKLESISAEEKTGKVAAFFYISQTGGYAVVRKAGDYVTKMIELAGGSYIFANAGGSGNLAASASRLTMEAFYAAAKDADIVIYNSTISGELHTMEEFLGLHELLGDFRAVQAGEVWCTNANLYQDTMHLGTVTEELHRIFSGTAEDEMQFLHRLN
ncbi:MAG: ABC transporter substrate-binding protein [Lachnospiraceae bacterium]|nr:ABC transporter substrate-binding protein [Lachnospiraceae bacterium]